MARVKTGLDGWIKKAAEEIDRLSVKGQIKAIVALQRNPQIASYSWKKEAE